MLHIGPTLSKPVFYLFIWSKIHCTTQMEGTPGKYSNKTATSTFRGRKIMNGPNFCNHLIYTCMHVGIC